MPNSGLFLPRETKSGSETAHLGKISHFVVFKIKVAANCTCLLLRRAGALNGTPSSSLRKFFSHFLGIEEFSSPGPDLCTLCSYSLSGHNAYAQHAPAPQFGEMGVGAPRRWPRTYLRGQGRPGHARVRKRVALANPTTCAVFSARAPILTIFFFSNFSDFWGQNDKLL